MTRYSRPIRSVGLAPIESSKQERCCYGWGRKLSEESLAHGCSRERDASNGIGAFLLRRFEAISFLCWWTSAWFWLLNGSAEELEIREENRLETARLVKDRGMLLEVAVASCMDIPERSLMDNEWIGVDVSVSEESSERLIWKNSLDSKQRRAFDSNPKDVSTHWPRFDSSTYWSGCSEPTAGSRIGSLIIPCVWRLTWIFDQIRNSFAVFSWWSMNYLFGYFFEILQRCSIRCFRLTNRFLYIFDPKFLFLKRADFVRDSFFPLRFDVTFNSSSARRLMSK